MTEGRSLKTLKPGEKGWIKELNLDQSIKRRFQDIGLAEGTKVACAYISPLGDPAAYLIKGTIIAIRNEDATKVVIESEGEAGDLV